MKRKVEADSSSWLSETRISYFGAALVFTPVHKVAAPRCCVQVQAGRREGSTAASSASLDQENKSWTIYFPPQADVAFYLSH